MSIDGLGTVALHRHDGVGGHGLGSEGEVVGPDEPGRDHGVVDQREAGRATLGLITCAQPAISPISRFLSLCVDRSINVAVMDMYPLCPCRTQSGTAG